MSGANGHSVSCEHAHSLSSRWAGGGRLPPAAFCDWGSQAGSPTPPAYVILNVADTYNREVPWGGRAA